MLVVSDKAIGAASEYRNRPGHIEYHARADDPGDEVARAGLARAMALGAAGYLVKPFDPVKIVDQINEALSRVQAPLIAK